MAATEAARYLERLQKEVFAATGEDFEAFESRSVDESVIREVHAALQLDGSPEQSVERHRRQVEEALAKRVTRFEDPLWASLLDDLMAMIEGAAAKVGIPVTERPLIGTLPLGQLNAMALRVPSSDDHVIVFQAGVFGFFNLMTKAVAACFPAQRADDGRLSFSTDIERVREGLARDDTPATRFFDFLAAYIVVGHPHAAQQYVLTAPALHLANLWREAGELFVLGHEYGHIVGRHFEQLKPGDQQPLGPTEVEPLPLDWRMEFEADQYGTVLALSAMSAQRKINPTLSFAAIGLVFSVMQVVEKALGVMTGDAVPPHTKRDSHPPFADRLGVLVASLKRLLRDDDETYAGAVELASTVDSVVAVLWETVEPAFHRLRQDGYTPAPIWTV
jgi:hypothetical protein